VPPTPIFITSRDAPCMLGGRQKNGAGSRKAGLLKRAPAPVPAPLVTGGGGGQRRRLRRG
jgi:hypothetical protein